MPASDPEFILAAVVRNYGPVEAISVERIPTPVPGPGEVLVRVKAAGVGPWDALIRSGKSVVPHLPPITLGSDLSGTVESVGGGVTDLRPGDPIFGVTNPSFEGAYAEAAIAQASMIARKPTSISDLQAAAVPVIGVTAMQMLFERAHVARGHRVLILGGAGNVGACAVQLARDAGARVTALVRANDVAVVRELGAEETMTSLGTPPPGGGFDVVIDTVGGDSARSSVRWLIPGGQFVSAVSDLDLASLDRLDIRAEFLLVEVTRARLEWIAERLLRGKLVVRVGEVLPLTDAARAHRMLAGQLPHAPGKIVLRISS